MLRNPADNSPGTSQAIAASILSVIERVSMNPSFNYCFRLLRYIPRDKKVPGAKCKNVSIVCSFFIDLLGIQTLKPETPGKRADFVGTICVWK